MFSQNLVLWISWNQPLYRQDAGRDKAAYIWIFPHFVKAGPTLEGVVVVVVVVVDDVQIVTPKALLVFRMYKR